MWTISTGKMSDVKEARDEESKSSRSTMYSKKTKRLQLM